MNLTLHGNASFNAVRSYGDEGIVIGESCWEQGVLVMPEGPVQAWGNPDPLALDEAAADRLLVREPEVVILGTGLRQLFPPAAFQRAFLARGVGCEIMDTGAACRTYNVLASESRLVLAALLPLRP